MKMKDVLILAMLVAVSGCKTTSIESKTSLERLHGVVIEKRANVKSYEAFNAPSDPYYVLEMGKVDEDYLMHMPEVFWKNKHLVTLRPSRTVTTDEISRFKGKQVLVTAEYTDGEWYKPAPPIEGQPRKVCYPIEPRTITAPDGSTKEEMRPAKVGRGYIVHSIKEERTPNN